MPLITESWVTLDLVRAHPDKVFLFGDNNQRRGKKGQAVIRDEPNTLGVRTKWLPKETPEAYFSDDQYDAVCEIVDADLAVVEELLRRGVTVVMPEAGLGTGLAQFDTRAPHAFAYFIEKLIHLSNIDTNDVLTKQDA